MFHRLIQFFTWSTLCLICSLHVAAQKDSAQSLYLADPTIFYDKGIYYLYGTVEKGSGEGFMVYTSTDKTKWRQSTHTPDGVALRKGEAFGNTGFWAPQVFQHGEKFYMAYVADERIAIAESAHPAGPFTQKAKAPLQAPVKQIDPFVFIDDDGKKYLYHVRLDSGNKIFVAEMSDDFAAIKPETLRLCITASEPWENTANATWPVAEGPAIIKQNGFYYLFYTANDFRNPDYATGYAVSRHPLGPWEKWSGNPVLTKKDIGQNGTGHGDFIKVKKDWWYVFHTHYSAQKVAPRKTALIGGAFKKTSGDTPAVFELKPQTFRYLVKDK